MLRSRWHAAVTFSLLDSDDLWMPEYLEVIKATLDRDPEAAFAYTDAWVFEDGSNRFSRSTAMAWANPPDPTRRVILLSFRRNASTELCLC